MNQRQSQLSGDDPQHPEGVQYIDMAIAFVALAPELILHDPRTFGIRSIPPRAGGMAFAMWLFAVSYAYDDRTPLLALTAVTTFFAIFAHICAIIQKRRGKLRHTRYNGRPWAMAILPLSEGCIKGFEPPLFILAGMGLHHLNHPLGSFVVIAGICYGIRIGAEYLGRQTRSYDLNDALTEQTIALQAVSRMRRR